VVRSPAKEEDQLVDLADALHRKRQALHHALEAGRGCRNFPGTDLMNQFRL
jgi:hypothetical protein